MPISPGYRANAGYRFEREDDGTVFVSPIHPKGGTKSLEAAVALHAYAKSAGGKAFDSNTGSAIGPDRRVYAPDPSWVSASRSASLPAAQADGFWPPSPVSREVVELCAPPSGLSLDVAAITDA